MTNRPILVGASNPHSADPAEALAPRPPGSSGWRLWKMCHEARGALSADYERMFDRRNLCSVAWDDNVAAHAGLNLVTSVGRGARIVAVGRDVWGALTSEARPEPRGSVQVDGKTIYYLHHPSGLCRAYNDALERWNTGAFLVDLARIAG